MLDPMNAVSQIIGISKDITYQVAKAKFNKRRLRDLERRCTALSNYCRTSEDLQNNVFFEGLLGTVTDCKEYVMKTRSWSFVVHFLNASTIETDYDRLVQLLDDWFQYIRENPDALLTPTTDKEEIIIMQKDDDDEIQQTMTKAKKHIEGAKKIYEAEHIAEKHERIVTLKPENYQVGPVLEDFMFGVVREGLEKNHHPVTIREIKNEIDGRTLSIIKQGTLLTWYLKDCEYILHTRGLVQKNGTWNIVADHTHYGSLHRYMKMFRLGTEDKIRIASKIAIGLSYMHRAGIIHKDIRSHNIALDVDFIPKITGFELCREAMADTVKVQTQQFTRKWWPPERQEGKKCTKATDVYSFGILMYEISTGNTEFEEVDLDNEYLTVHADYSRLLRDCMVLNPKDRPEIDDVVKRLTRLEATECHN